MKSMLCTRQEARSDRKLLPTLSQRPRTAQHCLTPRPGGAPPPPPPFLSHLAQQQTFPFIMINSRFFCLFYLFIPLLATFNVDRCMNQHPGVRYVSLLGASTLDWNRRCTRSSCASTCILQQPRMLGATTVDGTVNCCLSQTRLLPGSCISTFCMYITPTAFTRCSRTTAAFDLVMIVIACITLLPCALGPSKTLKKLQLCLPCHALLDLSQQMQKWKDDIVSK